VDFFRDDSVVADPYPYFERCARGARYKRERTTTC